MTRVEGLPAPVSETTHLRLIVDNARPGPPGSIRETLESVGMNFGRVYAAVDSDRFTYLLAEIDSADDVVRGIADARPGLGTPWGPTPD